MIEKYFAEFYVTEQELKEEIHSTLASLNIIDPENWPYELLEHTIPQKPSKKFLLILISSIPELQINKLNLDDFELIEVLRLIAMSLKMLLNGKELDDLLMKQLFMMCSNYFLGIRYLIASEILSRKLNRELFYNPDTVFSILTKESFSPDKAEMVLVAAKAAHHEIGRLLEDESASHFVEHIREFESAAEKYIKDNYSRVLLESFVRLANEALIKNAEMINVNIQLGISFTPADIKGWAEGAFKIVRQNTNLRLGIKRGGKREVKRFSWTNEKKVAFFKAVESLPKISTQSCWQFALDELVGQAFNTETVDWLKGNPAFKALPESLFREAIKVWRKYLDRENWKTVKREESPRSFEFRHALYLLEYPDKFTFSTLKTHYFAGKKLAKG